MASKIVQMGVNARAYLGTTLIGCANSIKYSAKVAKLPTSCQDSGITDTFLPGGISYDWSIEVLWKMFDETDEATNISFNDWLAAIQAGTNITIKFQGETTGDNVYTGIGYVESVEGNGKLKENGSASISGWFNSLTPTLKA